jgi:hypothetical protein
LGVAMADSPVGAAGWILEKFGQWADLRRSPGASSNIGGTKPRCCPSTVTPFSASESCLLGDPR